MKIYELTPNHLYKCSEGLRFNYPPRKTTYFFLMDVDIDGTSIELKYLTHEGIFKDGWVRSVHYEFEKIS